MAARKQQVANGGMFSTPKVTFSKETQDLLKVMMEESKLTNFQQRQISQTMKSGRMLPLRCPPTSSAPPMSTLQKKSVCKSSSHKCSIRTRETINKLEQNNEERYFRPAPSRYNSSLEKERLHNIMAFGTPDIKEDKSHDGCHRNVEEEEKEVDQFDEVLKEIEERKQFLDDMKRLGKDQLYNNKISTEISQKIRELELIDKQRCDKLLLVNN